MFSPAEIAERKKAPRTIFGERPVNPYAECLPAREPEQKTNLCPFTLLEVKLMKNGRDCHGVWWGIVPGLRLFAYRSNNGEHRGYFRAASRPNAEAALRGYFRSYFPDHITFSRETK